MTKLHISVTLFHAVRLSINVKPTRSDQRICFTFYPYMPITKSFWTGYPGMDNAFVKIGSLGAEFWPGKVTWSRENKLQHMKLKHGPYITLLKVKHFLMNSMISQGDIAQAGLTEYTFWFLFLLNHGIYDVRIKWMWHEWMRWLMWPAERDQGILIQSVGVWVGG